MIYIKSFESYEYENYSLSDMDFILDLWNDGFKYDYQNNEDNTVKQLSIESDLSVNTVKQILYTLDKRGDIKLSDKSE